MELCPKFVANHDHRMSYRRHELAEMTALYLIPIVAVVIAATSGGLVAGALKNDKHQLWTLVISYVFILDHSDYVLHPHDRTQATRTWGDCFATTSDRTSWSIRFLVCKRNYSYWYLLLIDSIANFATEWLYWERSRDTTFHWLQHCLLCRKLAASSILLAC